MDAAQAIRLTRGALRDADCARAFLADHPQAAAALRGRTLVYYNGAFSPPTRAHADLANAALQEPGVDALWLDPEPAKPGKQLWQNETMSARVLLCEAMSAEAGFRGRAGVGTLRRDLGPDLGQSAELFRTLRALVGAEGHLIWALGADVFEGMRYWREKALTCLQPGDTCDGLFLFARGGWTDERLRAAVDSVGGVQCVVRVLATPGVDISSTAAREALMHDAAEGQQKKLSHAVLETMLPGVARLCLSMPDLCGIYAQQVALTCPKPAAQLAAESLLPLICRSGNEDFSGLAPESSYAHASCALSRV